MSLCIISYAAITPDITNAKKPEEINTKILSITPASNFLGEYEGASDEVAEVFRKHALETFGTELKKNTSRRAFLYNYFKGI